MAVGDVGYEFEFLVRVLNLCLVTRGSVLCFFLLIAFLLVSLVLLRSGGVLGIKTSSSEDKVS